jgi:FkbM family methyltransferase
MIVNTRRLFVRLLPRMQISAVCDVGSMNGADALTFRNVVPDSNVYAFEPNPDNFRLMQANRAFQEGDIQLVPLAATDFDGEAEFFIVEANHSQDSQRRGMSSLYRRSDEWSPAAVVRVKTTRLDTFLADKCPPGIRLALWIDAEGKAYEVIDGIKGLAEHVHLLHVEVETSPCIGSNQRLYWEVKALLTRLGFAELATDQAHSNCQFNVLFVRSDLPPDMQFQTRVWLVHARLRYLMVRAVYRLCPPCVRRYHSMRSKWASSRGPRLA